MTTYSYAQLEALWEQAGGPSSVAPIAAAIALAESSGNSSALNLTDNGGTQTSVGLWQVSNGTHDYPASWATPQGNATEAVAKYQGAGNSFQPWGTYTSGAYKQYVNGSTTPNTNGIGSAGAAIGSLTGNANPNINASDCLISAPSIDLYVTSLGGGCIVPMSWGRAMLGGLLIGASGLITLVTLALLVSSMKNGNTGVKHAAGSVTGLFKNPQQTAQIASQTPEEALTAAAAPAPSPIKAATLPVAAPAAPRRKAVAKKSPSLFSAKALSTDLSLDDALALAAA